MTNTSGASAEQDNSILANALGECADPALIGLDPQGRIVLLTVSAARLLGLAHPSAPQCLGDLPAPIPELLPAALAKGSPFPELKFQLQSSGNRLCVSIRPLPWESNGASTGALLVLTNPDVLDRKQRAVQRLNRLGSLGTLSASMAHEIKNALVPVRTFIELLLERYPDADLGEIVKREMVRIDAIVSRMLGFAGPNRPVFSRLSLHQLLQHSLRMVESKLVDKSIKCRTHFTAAPECIEADSAQFQQALVNLFLNAYEAMSTGGTLAVRTELLSPETHDSTTPSPILITIEDTGPGIAPENLDRLFEPFFTTKPHGTGLGLAITQRIIQEHHGSISVESTLGRGTVFRITLPGATA